HGIVIAADDTTAQTQHMFQVIKEVYTTRSQWQNTSPFAQVNDTATQYETLHQIVKGERLFSHHSDVFCKDVRFDQPFPYDPDLDFLLANNSVPADRMPTQDLCVLPLATTAALQQASSRVQWPASEARATG